MDLMKTIGGNVAERGKLSELRENFRESYQSIFIPYQIEYEKERKELGAANIPCEDKR